MSSKKKKAPPRPMDAIREIVEDQQLQIADLTEILKKQNEEAEASSWFWAARTSD